MISFNVLCTPSHFVAIAIQHSFKDGKGWGGEGWGGESQPHSELVTTVHTVFFNALSKISLPGNMKQTKNTIAQVLFD